MQQWRHDKASGRVGLVDGRARVSEGWRRDQERPPWMGEARKSP